MGRRAHSIFEHFTRGAKLPNNSNRYEQLCNYCGVHFAQGRPETLKRHLRACPSVPAENLQSIFSETFAPLEVCEDISQATSERQGQSFDLASLQYLQQDINHEYHGLDTLASASLAQPFQYAGLGISPVDPQISTAMMEDLTENLATNNGDTRENIDNSLPSKVRKTRGAFSESRKQEVHEVRKRGACIRCRSLNKVCGPNSPCEQCKKIAHDRTTVWKFGCLRIDGKVFTLWDLKIHAHKAQHALESIKKEATGEFKETGTLNLAHSASSSLRLSAKVSQAETTSGTFNFIGEDKPTLVKLVTTYLDALRVQDFAASSPIREAFDLAENLISTHDKADAEELRSALRTWTAIMLLAKDTITWQVSLSDSSFLSKDGQHPNLLASSVNSRSHDIIISQLNEALESCIDKKSFTKLDRRLGMQKENNKTDILFLVLILLNAVERYTWHLTFLQHKLKAKHTDHRIDNWPLPDPPLMYLSQGIKLAALYNIWMHCRHVVPQMKTTPSGHLQIADASGADAILKDWFVKCNLRTEDLRVMDHAEFDPGDPTSLDGRLWAQMFLEKDESMVDRMKKEWFGN